MDVGTEMMELMKSALKMTLNGPGADTMVSIDDNAYPICMI